MKTLFLSLVFTISAISLFAQPENIMIGTNGEPEEPSIYINTKNPAIIMAAANINVLYISTDTGRTWSEQTMTSNSGVWGDPCIISDTAGDFLYFHLSNPTNGGHWIDRIVCQKYNTLQQQWISDSYMGLNTGPNYAQDKHWVTVEPTSNYIYATWTQFDLYGTSDTSKKSNIMFSTSTDGGLSWFSPAVRINETSGDCVDSDNTVEGAVPCMGPQNQIYVSWAGPNGLMFDKSDDGGAIFLDNDIFVSTIPGGWDYDVPGISRCNGLPITNCDISGGPYNGTIYINWSDQRNGTDNTDIWLAKSTDNGDTWSAPIRVNNDTTQTHQFLTWMDIDQSTGYLYFVFYDRHRYTDNQTDVTLAISKDGGQTFENYIISESPFVPVSSVFFGDYCNISADKGFVRPIWTRFDNQNQLSVWTALINPETILSAEPTMKNNEELSANIYPNPSNDIVYFSFKLKKASKVKLDVFDQKGSHITTLIDGKEYSAGMHIEQLSTNSLQLKAGVYQFKFVSENKSIVKSFMVK
ncbi:MAG: glycosyl hydrolase [Bacteroidetes bacterium]|nr:MAG: glycosyl hydrolase [Bacteroidota bacterium]